MNVGLLMRQKVRLVAIGATVTAASLLLFCLYSHAIHNSESPGPVEQWIKIGCELRRLQQETDGGVHTHEEYKIERQRLVQEENRITYHNDFPGDLAELESYKQARGDSPPWIFAVWMAIAAAIATAIAAAGWLEGAAFAAPDVISVAEDVS
ncbi:MAG: hypothetical protein V4719_30135 [Planctomycetota bacterium]